MEDRGPTIPNPKSSSSRGGGEPRYLGSSGAAPPGGERIGDLGGMEPQSGVEVLGPEDTPVAVPGR